MRSRQIYSALAAVALSVFPFGSSMAALPEGASSLNETYKDWRVVCVSGDQGDRCSMIQEQQAKDTGRRVLAVELGAPTDTTVQGVIIMPFGMALAKGITISVDDASAGSGFGFSTCLPQGCLVPIQFDASFVDKLKNGASMTISGTILDSGDNIVFSSSLSGFTAALNRLNELR